MLVQCHLLGTQKIPSAACAKCLKASLGPEDTVNLTGQCFSGVCIPIKKAQAANRHLCLQLRRDAHNLTSTKRLKWSRFNVDTE